MTLTKEAKLDIVGKHAKEAKALIEWLGSPEAQKLAAKSNRLIGRGCVNCHAQIHGSNSPAGNTFLR